MFGPERKREIANFVANWVKELHRAKIPGTRKVLLPLNIKTIEDMLAEFHDVFGKHGVTFWLRDGTALGVYRDGAIIPSDDDIDIGIWIEDLPKLEPALEELEKRGFAIYLRSRFLVGVLWRRETAEIVFSGSWGVMDDYNNFLDRTFFRELTQVEFRGRTYNIAGDPEGYLEFNYGPTWRTPIAQAWFSATNWLPPDQKMAVVDDFKERYPARKLPSGDA